LQIYQKPESAPNAIAQLYNLKTDPQEENNLIEQYPTLAAELKQLLETSKMTGRSRSRNGNVPPAAQ
jgi:hypothetical protein